MLAWRLGGGGPGGSIDKNSRSKSSGDDRPAFTVASKSGEDNFDAGLRTLASKSSQVADIGILGGSDKSLRYIAASSSDLRVPRTKL